jgi:hypothetical protein
MNSRMIQSPALACALVVYALTFGTVIAEDYESAHMFKPGDVISADVINELFNKVERSRKTPTVEDLLGVWEGTSYGKSGYSKTSDWLTGPNNLYVYLPNVEMTFQGGYDITYNPSNNVWETNQIAQRVHCSPTPFEIDSSSSISAYYDVEAGTLFKGGGGYPEWVIEKLSDTRIRLTSIGGLYANYAVLLVLDKRDIPPRKPTDLNLARVDRDVILSWADNSDDEFAFIVYCRDRLSGPYSNVYVSASNTITVYTNTVPDAGVYWYRVSATNAYGESTGSNVRKIVVP